MACTQRERESIATFCTEHINTHTEREIEGEKHGCNVYIRDSYTSKNELTIFNKTYWIIEAIDLGNGSPSATQ